MFTLLCVARGHLYRWYIFCLSYRYIYINMFRIQPKYNKEPRNRERERVYTIRPVCRATPISIKRRTNLYAFVVYICLVGWINEYGFRCMYIEGCVKVICAKDHTATQCSENPASSSICWVLTQFFGFI